VESASFTGVAKSEGGTVNNPLTKQQQ